MFLLALISAHALGALAAVVVGSRLRARRLLLASAAIPAVGGGWATAVALGAIEPTQVSYTWVSGIGLRLSLGADDLGIVFLLLIGWIGALVFIYSAGYFGRDRTDLGRMAGALQLFAGAMVGLVVADDVFSFFVFWELTSISSYLLIGTDDTKDAARRAARQALIITGGGGLVLMGGLVVLSQDAGTTSIAGILASPLDSTAAAVGAALVLIAAMTKSAQVPFHGWLPGAMSAPTPISAYLHSATMVKAGVFVLARFSPAFTDTMDWWTPALVLVGGITMVTAGWQALRQDDVKLLLAHSTVSQLGFMVLLVGSGSKALTFAGLAVVVAHALLKASLFLTVGVVDTRFGTRDRRVLSGLRHDSRLLFAVAVVGAASMAGGPPLLGFVAKEAALEASIAEASVLAVVFVVAGSALTVAYNIRFLRIFTGARLEPRPVKEPSPLMVGMAAVLAAGTVIAGLVPAVLDPLINRASVAVQGGSVDKHLALWHGLTPGLALSGVAIGLGTVLAWQHRAVAGFQDALPRLPAASAVFDGMIDKLIHFAVRIEDVFQHRSLPSYLATAVSVVILVPGSALLTQTSLPDSVPFADTPAQIAVTAVLVVAALGAVVVRSRLGAVLLLGAVGYSVAILFVVQGAPDLAITQLLVESVAVIALVLVVRRLPHQFERERGKRAVQSVRLLIAVLVGFFAAGAAAVAAAARTATPVSQEQIARALPEGGGKNVVNVILTDIRALDTMGEIVVLAVAAIGAVHLLRTSTRNSRSEP